MLLMFGNISVQGKLGFSCEALLNICVFLCLMRQAVRPSGASASHWHSVNVAARGK